MNILLLEDLDTFAETLQKSLQTRHRELGRVSIERVGTELEFRHRLPELVQKPFDVAVFDVMVSWCTLEDLETPEGQNPPPEVIAERDGIKKWRSGVRCRQMFNEALSTASRPQVPCVFYTILDKEDLKGELSGDTPLVVKQGELGPLVETILKITGNV
jgi:hypothetical protein